MRKTCFTLLVLIFVGAFTTGILTAQNQGELYCVVTLEGQNRNRTVDGSIHLECGAGIHSPPFGNWGVRSNYGGITDTDQFRGWKWEDGPSTKRQWNSCTTLYPPPDCGKYNDSACMTQRKNDVVIHGKFSYRFSENQCLPAAPPPGTGQSPGCSNMNAVSVTQATNYMHVYELDWPDGDDLVETLYFPGTSVTLTSCSYHGCPERTSGWVQMTGSSSFWTDVRAELRMKASAEVEGLCDYDEWD